jgi:hypothetical protein
LNKVAFEHFFDLRLKSQEQAIENALFELEKEKSAGKSWAFVREGLLRRGEEKTDVLLTTVWAPRMATPLYLSQAFEPFAKRGAFRLLGPLELIEVEASATDRERITRIVREASSSTPRSRIYGLNGRHSVRPNKPPASDAYASAQRARYSAPHRGCYAS